MSGKSQPPKQRALVGNAGDPEQVRKAGQKIRTKRDQELNDLRTVLAMPEGRRVLWLLLQEAGTFRSAFDRETAAMAYYVGRQDYGHAIIGHITEADVEAWLLMQREAAQIEKQNAPAENESPMRAELEPIEESNA